MGMEKEVRKLKMDNLRAKNTDDGVNLSGYITKFDDRAEIFGFYETINRKAFDNTLKEDRNILALFDHDTSKILGSTRSGSLKLSTDETRSEEHTSELQSRGHLVCRLLLEKKKTYLKVAKKVSYGIHLARNLNNRARGNCENEELTNLTEQSLADAEDNTDRLQITMRANCK